MKLRNIFRVLSAGVVLAGLASCHNKEAIFPDYEGGITAYFAYQYPVRTIVLGKSETFDTSLDNEHKCIIYGTIGGSYKGKDVVIDIEVDNTLTENLYFADGSPVKAMPESYYTLADDQLIYGGSHLGGVEVSLSDAFFADPDALKNTYVIPVVMKNIVKGADQILTGTPLLEGDNPIRTNSALWNVAPMDYTLYCVKYINPWDGSWLRRGVDQITENGVTTENVRHETYVEDDEVCFLTTETLNSVVLPVSTNVEKVSYFPGDAGSGLTIINTEKKDANWGAQVWYQLSEPMKSGKTYTFKCMAKATAQYDWCSVFLQSSTTGDQNYNHGMGFPTQWEERTMTIKPDKDIYDKLTWNFGDFVGTLYLDDVSFVEDGTSTNLIANGDFENQSKDGWASWSGFESLGVGYGMQEKREIVSVTCDLVLDFAANGDCTITSGTEGITASGSGKYVENGEKLAWGNKDRDGIYIDYKIDFGSKQFASRDTLVSRSREVNIETYVPTYKE